MLTGSMFELLIATLLFVGGHFALSRPPIRGRLTAAVGEEPFKGLYSALMIAALVWMALSYRAAPVLPLWPHTTAARLLPLVVTPFAFVLLAGGLRKDNPTLVPTMGRNKPLKGDLGIFAITRHPLMWAFGLWGLAHLPPNGDVASLVFFGGIAALALGGTLALDEKKRARAPQAWADLAARTSNLPFRAVLEGRARVSLKALPRPIFLGLAAYALLLHFHAPLFGVSPLP